MKQFKLLDDDDNFELTSIDQNNDQPRKKTTTTNKYTHKHYDIYISHSLFNFYYIF